MCGEENVVEEDRKASALDWTLAAFCVPQVEIEDYHETNRGARKEGKKKKKTRLAAQHGKWKQEGV
jgi:hypothetical protein